MAALNHVCVWSNTGWKKITVEEILEENPYGGISAKSGLLMCELCGQYVTLAKGPKIQPYFKHSRSEDDKSCEERTFGTGGRYQSYDIRPHELPLRLNYTASSISLEVGLLSLPAEVRNKYPNNYIFIQPVGRSSLQFSFERLQNEQITYLNVGKPATEYRILTKFVDGEISKIWPKTIKGVDSRSTLFDARTGKKLPYDADVIVNREYFLLLGASAHLTYNTKSISVQQIFSTAIDGWRLYRVKAYDLSESSAKFFLQYHARLTAKPVDVLSLWPACINTPYLIQYDSKCLFMYVQGDATPYFFPSSATNQTWSDRDENIKLLSISGNIRQQLLSVGRSNALTYTYTRRQSVDRSASRPVVIIRDLQSNVLNEEVYAVIPQGDAVEVETRFDGVAIISKEEECIHQIFLHGRERTLIGSLKKGMTIQFIIGNDCVRTLSFPAKNKRDEVSEKDDIALLSRLQRSTGRTEIPDHSLAAVVRYMKDLPASREWLLAQIKRGRISTSALNLVKATIRQRQNK